MVVTVQQRHVEIVETLLKNGCNTNVRAKKIDESEELPNCTAFELSLYLESIDMVKMVAFHENWSNSPLKKKYFVKNETLDLFIK